MLTRNSAAVAVFAALALGAALGYLPERHRAERAPDRPIDEPAETHEPATTPAPGPASGLAETASAEELRLWNDRGCVTCHGADGRGTEMGPDVIEVVPLYLSKYASREAALRPLAAYIFDPKGTPKLRAGEDGEFRSAMPGIGQFAGGTREEATALAGLLLRLAR